jgi:signal transduction histidine kinase
MYERVIYLGLKKEGIQRVILFLCDLLVHATSGRGVKVTGTNNNQTYNGDKHAQQDTVNAAPPALEAIQKANAELEQQLKDLNVELQATVDEFLRAHERAEKAREEAERANSVKSAFLASMSHELRTPLNAIINLTKFVANGDLGPLNETQKETLNEVIASGKHLLSLINDVLDMSKIESGSLNLFIEDNVHLGELLDAVCSTGKILLAEKPVELTANIEAGLPHLRADRQRIYQVLLNIVSNACKFTRQGSIKLRAYQEGEDVVVSVQDTGQGIAAEDHALVFEAFKQTCTGLRQAGGTGLGMPISKNLIEAHGGRIWLESEVGKGSTFFVSIPVKSQQLVPMFSAPERHK